MDSKNLGGLDMMHTMNTAKYIVKNGSTGNLQTTLNDLVEQGYEIVNLYQFMTADGLKFSLVMKR
jgi:hypothetical protein